MIFKNVPVVRSGAGKSGQLVARLAEGKILPARPDRRMLLGADTGGVV